MQRFIVPNTPLGVALGVVVALSNDAAEQAVCDWFESRIAQADADPSDGGCTAIIEIAVTDDAAQLDVPVPISAFTPLLSIACFVGPAAQLVDVEINVRCAGQHWQDAVYPVRFLLDRQVIGLDLRDFTEFWGDQIGEAVELTRLVDKSGALAALVHFSMGDRTLEAIDQTVDAIAARLSSISRWFISCRPEGGDDYGCLLFAPERYATSKGD